MERLEAMHKKTFEEWTKSSLAEKSSLAKKIFLFLLKTIADQKKPSYYSSKYNVRVYMQVGMFTLQGFI